MAVTQNKKSRTLVNIIGIPSLLFVIWQGSYWFLGLFVILILVAALELVNLSKKQKSNPNVILLLCGLFLLLSSQIFKQLVTFFTTNSTRNNLK